MCQATAFPFFFYFWTMLSGTWFFWLPCPKLGVRLHPSGSLPIQDIVQFYGFLQGLLNYHSHCCSKPSSRVWDRLHSKAKVVVSMAHHNPDLIPSRKPTVHELFWQTASWERKQTARKWKGTTYKGPVASEGRVTQSLKNRRRSNPSVCLLALAKYPFLEPQKPEFTRILLQLK